LRGFARQVRMGNGRTRAKMRRTRRRGGRGDLAWPSSPAVAPFADLRAPVRGFGTVPVGSRRLLTGVALTAYCVRGSFGGRGSFTRAACSWRGRYAWGMTTASRDDLLLQYLD